MATIIIFIDNQMDLVTEIWHVHSDADWRTFNRLTHCIIINFICKHVNSKHVQSSYDIYEFGEQK